MYDYHTLIFMNVNILVIRNVADELRIFESINHPHLINHFLIIKNTADDDYHYHINHHHTYHQERC